MAKRRTKKQKMKAKHRFIENKQKATKPGKIEPIVKGQFKKAKNTRHNQPPPSKKATNSAKSDDLKDIKKDLLKSLFLASLILGTEVMIYLIW